MPRPRWNTAPTSAVLCIRRKEIQRVNPQLWMGKAGFLRHFADLSDEWKWRFMQHMFSFNLPAPQDAYDRLSRLPGGEIRQNAGWKSVRLVGGRAQEIEIETVAGDVLRADFLIVAVGFEVDFASAARACTFRRSDRAVARPLFAFRWARSARSLRPILISARPSSSSRSDPAQRPISGESETSPTGRWSAWDCRAQRSAA